jgi:protocatechuate 3,4-dioxygenase beta subunit
MFMLDIAFMLLLFPAGEAAASVEGKVLSSATGEPLRRAEVSIQRPASGPVVVRSIGGQRVDSSAPPAVQTATTDDDGRFSLSGLPPGTYTLSAGRTGFLAREYDARGRQVENPIFKLTAGQVLKDQVIRLTPQGVITGRVYDDEGNPAAKAAVKLLAWAYSRGARRLLPTGSAETDNRGEYRIASVAPGKYFLAAAPPPLLLEPGARRPSGANSQMGLAAVYYPGIPKPAPAAALEFGAGAERSGMDLRLPKVNAFRIRGKVLDSAGEPVARGDVIAIQPDLVYRAGYQPCFIEADGSFELVGVPPGVYRLYARRQPGLTAERIVEVAADIDGLVMAAAAGRMIAGRVALEKQDKGPFRSIRVVVQRTEAGVFDAAYAEVGDDGSFTLPNVRPGRYQLTVAGLPEDWYVVSSGLPGREMDFTTGVPESFQLTLATDGGRVTGKAVHEGKPVPGAFVAVLPLDYAERPALFSRMVRADQRGGFTLAGIPPGEYRVLAWEDAQLGAVQDLDFLKQFDSRGERIKVARGETVEREAPVFAGQ